MGRLPGRRRDRDASIALFPLTGASSGVPERNAIAMRHLAFRADAMNFAHARGELTSRAISCEFQDHGIAHSIYFQDPDGHQIEITTYDLKT
jgi:catechol-2,3-dioxygenase